MTKIQISKIVGLKSANSARVNFKLLIAKNVLNHHAGCDGKSIAGNARDDVRPSSDDHSKFLILNFAGINQDCFLGLEI